MRKEKLYTEKRIKIVAMIAAIFILVVSFNT